MFVSAALFIALSVRLAELSLNEESLDLFFKIEGRYDLESRFPPFEISTGS